jgi:hypothetical protein
MLYDEIGATRATVRLMRAKTKAACLTRESDELFLHCMPLFTFWTCGHPAVVAICFLAVNAEKLHCSLPIQYASWSVVEIHMRHACPHGHPADGFDFSKASRANSSNRASVTPFSSAALWYLSIVSLVALTAKCRFRPVL